MTSRSVLISGAGVAGPTLAYFLARRGFTTTVVERAQGLRSSGNPVDVRGPALPVADRMKIMPRLRDAATTATAMAVLDGRGRKVATVAMAAARKGSDEVELPRGELARALYEAARDDVEFLFDDTIVAMDQTPDAVDVTFDRAAPRRFDLVVGADGLHSLTRRLAFGPESRFVHHMGVYVATMPLDEPVDHPNDILMFNTPGRLVSIHPSRGKALVAFIFRGGLVDGFDHRDMAQHKRMVADAYQGIGWRVPQLLERIEQTGDLYFDSVSHVRLPKWSNGRVVLLGDAASCVSLFGDGSSLAMAGASTLAESLGAEDYQTAFGRYEAQHRTLVEPKQRRVGQAAGLIVPKTRTGIAVRNFVAKVWPGGL